MSRGEERAMFKNLMTLSSSWWRPFVSGNMKKMTGRKRRRTRPKARKVPERLRAACA
jgi:hypothetical protein